MEFIIDMPRWAKGILIGYVLNALILVPTAWDLRKENSWAAWMAAAVLVLLPFGLVALALFKVTEER